MLLRFDCSMSEAAIGFVCEAKTAVSSANVPTVTESFVGRSAVQSKYRIGPSTLPCLN